MTMISAQPLTLTGEQHDRMWGEAGRVRGLIDQLADLQEALDTLGLSKPVELLSAVSDALEGSSNAIERILIDAQDAAPPATAA